MIIDTTMPEDAGALAPPQQPEGLPKGAVLNEDGSVTLTLSKPVRLEATDAAGRETMESYATFNLKELTGADIRRMGSAAGAQRFDMAIALSTGLAPAIAGKVFDRMRARDVTALGQVITFLNGEMA